MVMGQFINYRESPARIDSILSAIKQRNVGAIVEPVDHGLDPILAVHSREFVDYFESAYKVWVENGGNPDGVFPDTFAVRLPATYGSGGNGGRPGYFCYDMTAVIAQQTFAAAYDAAQVALTGADLLLRDSSASNPAGAVFALCRPPGHHASGDLAGGYCYFNNAGIAAEHIIRNLGGGKVVILDVDYHHGNGTQVMFYERHNPMYVSLHGSPDYPYYWGSAEEKGAGEGLGSNVNVPLPLCTKDAEYLAALERVIEEHIKPFGVQTLVVSLGVDTFGGDPVGSFELTSDCFTQIGGILARIGVPTLFVMEGGYAIDALGNNVCNVLQGFELPSKPPPMPQNFYIEEAIKKHGRRLDHDERKRKKEARQAHKTSATAQKLHGFKAKLYNKKRHSEKIQMKKTIKMHEERNNKHKADDKPVQEGAVPTYLLDRENQSRAKVLSNMIKQKRKEKAGKWQVPLPKVKGMDEAEVFKVVKSGKRQIKQWKRLVTKATFVGEGFTRKPPKYERFIRPMALRYKKAHVTHPELGATFCLPILGVKKNPSSPMYTQLGVMTKGTVIEVNVSELGLVTQGGKVVWGKFAQITNNPENDGCINAVLLV
eukprot:jgi/Hompol1/2101/HPOL_002822-RA